MTGQAQAIAAAGQAFWDALERLNARDPHEAAVAAWEPGGPSVEQIEADIRAERAAALGRAS